MSHISRKKIALMVLGFVLWLMPSYQLFAGSWELDPKGNVEISLLIGWALAFAALDSILLLLKEIEELWRRLSSWS